MNNRRLYRCRHDRQIAGVASGIAEYFEIDPTLVRVAFIVSALLGGVSILIYFVLAFVMPLEPEMLAESAPVGAAGADPNADPGADPGVEGAASAEGAIDGAVAGSPATSPSPHVHGQSQGRRAKERRPGQAGLVFGVMLIVFGTIALAGSLIPAWVTGIHLGPALILALGIALVVSAARGSTVSR